MNPVLVTGGAGFIGSALVRRLVAAGVDTINVDLLTYAGNLASLETACTAPNHHFEQVDIRDAAALSRVFDHYHPRSVVHLAAESHVDRSIDSPDAFVQTNVVGTLHLLQSARKARVERFVHVSTDEVFGTLPEFGAKFDETTPYDPRSPYAASKAASDHLVRAWMHTYGVPAIVTNCSNNYGPYQFPEKLIPLVILTALRRDPIPVYGDGMNVRDWIHVEDHIQGLIAALYRGRVGTTCLFGGDAERRNIDVVRSICRILDDLRPATDSYETLITYVRDRPGHDRRYAIDSSATRERLGWKPLYSFEDGLRSTVRWYLENLDWSDHVQSGAYRGERLGVVLET
jgi:dTDP-glucose 4,6-dehydratase